MATATAPAAAHHSFGKQWGESLVRCFSIAEEFEDAQMRLRLQPVPESFICPISTSIMEDPVAAVDGTVYDRQYIEHWFRQRAQQRRDVTSPATGLPLASTNLISLEALRIAIETYVVYRPELQSMLQSKRSLGEAAGILQEELLEKQATYASVQDEITRLQSKLRTVEAERDAQAIGIAETESAKDAMEKDFLQELGRCNSEIERLKYQCTMQEISNHPKQQLSRATQTHDSRISLAEFLEMAAITRARLPHVVQKPQHMKMLLDAPWSSSAQYSSRGSGCSGSLIVHTMGKEKGCPEEVPAAPVPPLLALVEIDARYCAVKARYAAEEAALKKKFYDERQAPIIAERCQALASDATEEDKEFGTPACKGFWSKALGKLAASEFNVPVFAIQEYDEPVLEYLDDIRAPDVDAKSTTRIEFVFKENPFFTNSILWVEVTMDRDFTKPWKDLEALEMKSSGVDWKPGKDVTVEKVEKSGKVGGAKKAKQKNKPPKEVPRCSFFRSLFQKLNVGERIKAKMLEARMDIHTADIEMMQKEFLSRRRDKINEIKYKLIPYAVHYYTGQIGGDADDEQMEEFYRHASLEAAMMTMKSPRKSLVQEPKRRS